MDQTLPTPLSVKTRQNIAAWLLVLTGVLNLTLLFFYNFLIGLFIPIVNTIAWILLYTTASNKATRTASIIIITLSLIPIAKMIVLNSNPIPSEYISILIVVGILQSLITIYAYSILLKGNNSINIEDRAWIGFLIISNIGLLIMKLFYDVLLYTNIVDYELFRPYNFGINIGWMLWNIVYFILVMVAEFRMAKCAAFTGNYNSEPASKEIYSPINKYFAATLISVIVVLGLLYIIYNNILSIENIF